jgi:type 1 glutamine amidotransferase
VCLSRPLVALLFLLTTKDLFAQPASESVRVLALYSTNVESDHVEFARQAIPFFSDVARQQKVQFESSTNWDDLASNRLKHYKMIIWLNDFPHTPAQRHGFEVYMQSGGEWLGFHIAAYNDKDTHWPWFASFLGGGVFYSNNWPPLPASLAVEKTTDPVVRHLPHRFVSPPNEWYIWKPSPRLNPEVKVLVTLDPSNYPLGFKDVLLSGDLPVVWTNTRYSMLYVNMGHGDKIFTSPTQNVLLRNAFVSVLSGRDKPR